LRSSCLQIIDGSKEKSKNKNEGKTRKKTLVVIGYLMERRGYWKLKEETLDSAVRELALEEAIDLS
jgi:hypothetical protein